jgi:hypothetical protein
VDALTRGGGAARKKDLAGIPTNLDKSFFKVALPVLLEAHVESISSKGVLHPIP